MTSAVAEGPDDTLGRSEHRVQRQDKTADTAEHTLVRLSLGQMAFPSSLDAKSHFGEAEWSPQCHLVPTTAHLFLWAAGPLQAQRAAEAAFTRCFLMHVALK